LELDLHRASNQKTQKLDLALGYSHNIVFNSFEVTLETISEKVKQLLSLHRFDKQLLESAKIRGFRKPEYLKERVLNLWVKY
jgi:ribosomal protein L6P/L9E